MIPIYKFSQGGYKVIGWYEGECKNGQAHGQGKCNYINVKDNRPHFRDVYVGEWKDGKRDGYGKHSYEESGRDICCFYEGEWKNDKRHGEGTMSHGICSPIYKGSFKDDKMHGKGKFCQNPDKWGNSFYEGEWKNGKCISGSI